MRGLRPDERAALIAMVRNPKDTLHWDDDAGEEVRDRLAAQGRVTRIVRPASQDDFLPPGEDPGDWETVHWEPTPLGLLALRVCTTESS